MSSSSARETPVRLFRLSRPLRSVGPLAKRSSSFLEIRGVFFACLKKNKNTYARACVRGRKKITIRFRLKRFKMTLMSLEKYEIRKIWKLRVRVLVCEKLSFLIIVETCDVSQVAGKSILFEIVSWQVTKNIYIVYNIIENNIIEKDNIL